MCSTDDWSEIVAMAIPFLSACNLASTSRRALTAAAAVAGGTLSCIGGFSLVSAWIVVGDSKVKSDESPFVVSFTFPFLLASVPSLCRLSSIATYCSPFCKKLIKAPGGMFLSALLVILRPKRLSCANEKAECTNPKKSHRINPKLQHVVERKNYVGE